MKLRRTIALALLTLSPVFYVAGASLLIGVYIYCAAVAIAMLNRLGVPSGVGPALVFFVVPIALGITVATIVPESFLGRGRALRKRLDAWIDSSLKAP